MFQGVEDLIELIYCIFGIENRLGQIRLNDVLSRRMTLITHYLPSGRLQKGLW
jgi:hypothetical protein